MSAAAILAAAREEAYATPLETLDMSDGARFAAGKQLPFFERLRKEAPVHYQPNGMFGPFWSITSYKDIMATDTNHKVFSSAHGITLVEPRSEELKAPMFIAMDPPKHDDQRKAVSGIVAPGNLANMEALIRSAGRVPRQRTTTYGEPLEEQVRRSFGAAPLAEPLNPPVREGGLRRPTKLVRPGLARATV